MVPFVSKFDDDTAPNLRLLLPLLRRYRCDLAARPMLFFGAINWAGFVPRAYDVGVRGDRCGFGWSLHASLSNFGRAWGTKGAKGYVEACDVRGSVLPFPYATGAGYIFSAPLLHFISTSPEVVSWVASAAGSDHEELQWQKFEDTSTAYWLTYAPETVHYIDVGPLIHDAACHADGMRKRDRDGTYRPPSNASLLVHNLKSPSAFAFAWQHMQDIAVPYSHADCLWQVQGQGRRAKKHPH